MNVPKCTSNHIVRWELGRYPLTICINYLLMKYLHRLELQYDNILLYTAYQTCKSNNLPWYKNVCDMLKINGFGDLPGTIKHKPMSIALHVKSIMISQYIQSVSSKYDSNIFYKGLLKTKDPLTVSQYLTELTDVNLRNNFAKVRLQYFGRRITFSNTCPKCKSTIENISHHFITSCPDLQNYRILSNINLSHSNFINILNEHNNKEVCNFINGLFRQILNASP